MTKNQEKGQALITLIFFTVIAVVIITAAVSVLFTNSLSTTSAELGQEAYYAAEAGVEDGLLRLLRDPNASGGNISISGDTSASYTINSDTIVSIGIVGTVKRKIEVQTLYTDGIRTISSWKEIE